MIKWIVGLNGAGKTVLLDEMIDNALQDKEQLITNAREVHYENFDMSKIDELRRSDYYNEIFDYGNLEIVNNKLAIINTDFRYTNAFLDIVTLLCRNGDILILDEPELGLFGLEIDLLVKIFEVLLPLYKGGYIVTHCQELFGLYPDDFYWCDNYNLLKITEEELYEHIGKF